MPEDFVAQLQEYLQRKIEKSDGSSEDRREIENIKHTIQRLLDAREHKILDAVMYAARTGMKPDNLSENEQKMFDVILKEITNYRKEFLKNIENGKNIKSRPEEKVINTIEKKNTVEAKVRVESGRKYHVKRDVSRFVLPDLKEMELKKGMILKENELPKTLNDLLLKRGIIEITK